MVDLKERTKNFTLSVHRALSSHPNSSLEFIYIKQLIRSASSVGANYRSACVARSLKEYHAKLCIVLEEIDESNYWIEVLDELLISKNDQWDFIKNEALELLKIFHTSRKTVEQNLKNLHS